MEVPGGNPLRRGLRRERAAEPCTVVIFGATGDLAHRKLLPALYNLQVDRLLPSGLAVVGAGRQRVDDAGFRDLFEKSVREHSRRPFDPDVFAAIAPRLSFLPGEYGRPEDFARLREHLARLDRERGTGGNRLFYLAVPPSAFSAILRGAGEAGLGRPGPGGAWSRAIVEKPFGRDEGSARRLNAEAQAVFGERSLFRIDHYLGKETVQNLFVFRFANAIFEPLWSRTHVDHVQIAVAETLGVEGRGAYFEEAGIARDILQNHVLQLLALTAMEPPDTLHGEAIRDEKVKVLRALRPLAPEEVAPSTVRAQYAAGAIDGRAVPGYRQEKGVDPASRTETYVAHRLYVDTWRWAGVPFYLRTGKRLPKRVTEITLQFKDVPLRLHRPGPDDRLVPNTLTLRVQPDEGIALRFVAKVPGPRLQIEPVAMDFRYGSSWGKEPPEAYERLLLEAILGDATLFLRADEVEASWAYLDRIRAGWDADRAPLEAYPAGSWGPAAADALLAADGRAWRRL